MRNLRNCIAASLNTGTSKCPIDWGKVKGAIVVEPGQKLPAKITADSLAELCHADRPQRIYPFLTFVEYAKNGGEPQVSAVGYGPNQYNGLSPQTDAFTMNRFDEMLNAQLMRCSNREFDVYFWDDNRNLVGYNDGTDVLAGIPMSMIYPTTTAFASSGAKASMIVNFCHKDIEDSMLHFDYNVLDFNPSKVIKGLTECQLVEETSNQFRIVEKLGGFDRTEEFGTTFAAAVSSVMTGASSAQYTAGLIKITGEGPLAVKRASDLYKSEIKWIDIVEIVKAV